MYHNGTTRYEGGLLSLQGAESIAKVQDLSGVSKLALESQQDETSSSQHQSNWSVSGSSGTNGIHASASGGNQSDESSSRHTRQLTALRGERIVGDLDSISLKGGQLTGDLSGLSTKVLHNEDLLDVDRHTQDGVSLGASTGGQDLNHLSTPGVTSVGIQSGGHHREEGVHSFVSQGLRVGKHEGSGRLATTESDIRSVIKNDQRQGVNVEIEDIRMITDTAGYVSDTWSDLSALGDSRNWEMAAKRVSRAAGDLTDATIKEWGGHHGVKQNGGLLGDYQNKTKLREATLQFASLPENRDKAAIIQNPDAYSPDQRAEALQTFNHYASEQFGVRGPDATGVYNGDALKGQGVDGAIHADTHQIVHKSDLEGLYDRQAQQILINDALQDGSTSHLVQTDGHELKHHIDAARAQRTGEAGADRFGGQAYDALKDEWGQGASATLQRPRLVAITQVAGGYERGNVRAAGARDVLPLTVFVHGTWSSPQDADPQFLKTVGNTFGEKVVQLDWAPGELSVKARSGAAHKLNSLVKNHVFTPGEELNMIGHSHGGNVLKEFTQLYDGDKKIDTMVILGTPQLKEYQLNQNNLEPNAKVINVYDKNDMVQTAGALIGGTGERKMKNAYNVPVIQNQNLTIDTEVEARKLGFSSQVRVPVSIGPRKSHTELDSKLVWDKSVAPVLRLPKIKSNDRDPEIKPVPIEVKSI